MAVGNFWDKVKKVAFLDPTIYKYVSDDEDSYKDAMLIVALSSFSVAIQKVGVDETMSFQANFIFTFLSWFFVSAIIFYFGSLWFAEPPPEIEEEEEEDEEDLLTSQEVKKSRGKGRLSASFARYWFCLCPGNIAPFRYFQGFGGFVLYDSGHMDINYSRDRYQNGFFIQKLDQSSVSPSCIRHHLWQPL